MRSLILFSGAALGLLACTSEETPTDPSGGASLGRVAGSHYVAAALDPLHPRLIPTDFNPRGQVVGSLRVQVGTEDDPRTEDHAVLWEKGVVTDLGTSFGQTTANAISPSGQIVGVAEGASNPPFALFWDRGVLTATFLSTLPGTFLSGAFDINPAGQIVGYNETDDNRAHAVRWDNGVVTDLGTLGGNSYAGGINPSGQIVGSSTMSGSTSFHAFLWTNGVMHDLGTLGGDASSAYAINSAGQVVGASEITPGQFQAHAFLWAHGVMTDLGALGGPNSYAADINASGQVVGAAETADGTLHAFIWEDGVMTDLGAIAGGTESRATAINSAGDVLGIANGAATLWSRH
jgi:probable HAF family extracellular repeat protein